MLWLNCDELLSVLPHVCVEGNCLFPVSFVTENATAVRVPIATKYFQSRRPEEIMCKRDGEGEERNRGSEGERTLTAMIDQIFLIGT